MSLYNSTKTSNCVIIELWLEGSVSHVVVLESVLCRLSIIWLSYPHIPFGSLCDWRIFFGKTLKKAVDSLKGNPIILPNALANIWGAAAATAMLLWEFAPLGILLCILTTNVDVGWTTRWILFNFRDRNYDRVAFASGVPPHLRFIVSRQLPALGLGWGNPFSFAVRFLPATLILFKKKKSI